MFQHLMEYWYLFLCVTAPKSWRTDVAVFTRMLEAVGGHIPFWRRS